MISFNFSIDNYRTDIVVEEQFLVGEMFMQCFSPCAMIKKKKKLTCLKKVYSSMEEILRLWAKQLFSLHREICFCFRFPQVQSECQN